MSFSVLRISYNYATLRMCSVVSSLCKPDGTFPSGDELAKLDLVLSGIWAAFTAQIAESNINVQIDSNLYLHRAFEEAVFLEGYRTTVVICSEFFASSKEEADGKRPDEG